MCVPCRKCLGSGADMDDEQGRPVPSEGTSSPAATDAEDVPTPTPTRPPGTRSVAARSALGAGKALVGIASALVLVATGMAHTKVRDLSTGVTKSDAIATDAPKSKDGAVNILLMGLDSRKDQNGNPLPPEILEQLRAGTSDKGGYNTNTLILLHVPNNGSRAIGISIPRDDYVDVEGLRGYKQIKIKEAYGVAKAYAEEDLWKTGVTDRNSLEQQGREAGRKKSIETVRNFLGGIPIDHFAELNLAGFYELATALDGVEVCLKHATKDADSAADFPAGRQTLDGAQALSFVRQRKGLDNGDLDRTHRQQAFLASATHKLRSVGTFTDQSKLQKLIDVVKRHVVIDSGMDVFGFAQQAQALTGGNVEFRTLPIEGFAMKDGQSINTVDVPKIQAIVQSWIGENRQPPPASGPTTTASQEATAPQTAPPALQGNTPPSTDGATPSPGREGSAVSGDVPCVD
jgi:LCP family protein required for cell wall assembly